MRGTVIASLGEHARQRPDEVAVGAKVNGKWAVKSWRELEGLVDRAALSFLALGLEKGDRVAVLVGNRPEWTIVAVAAMKVGAVPTGVYQTCSANQVDFILRHSSAALIVAENAAQVDKLQGAMERNPRLRTVVSIEADCRASMAWQEFLELGSKVEPERLAQRSSEVTRDDLGTLIYTSGTTGEPKGVMLSHSNIAETCRIARQLHDIDESHRTVSYLPLAHVAEQMISIHMAVATGYTTYFAADPRELPVVLAEVEPTIFFGVPRVWEKLHSAIRAKVLASSRWRQWVFERAISSPNRLTEHLVARTVRQALGLGKVRFCASGAAPIGVDILEFFAALGLEIYEVWGLSETSGPVTWNHKGGCRLGTVGPAIPEVEVRLDEDNEVLARGPNIFAGYLDDQEATEAVLDSDGWLRTGDLGSLDDEGFLSITGRKKELIITSGGKNVSPVAIEEALKEFDLVAEAMVIGDRRKFISALIVLDDEIAAVTGATRDRVSSSLESMVEAANRQLSRVERVRAFRVVPPFTVEKGELTPTLKLRRTVILAHYKAEIDGMYGDPSSGLSDGGFKDG